MKGSWFLMDKAGLIMDTNNGFFKLIATELVEFFALLFIGILLAFAITGSWELTGIVILIDILQNAVVFIWLKYIRTSFWAKRKV